ncbi:hypothetical protein ACFVT5_16785 [Streptomyces sp. NPDC058001]|uniref:hypothetical protein n=1 Tax=Streptomyces sp. NPDC058001 TaxID=3346300 RepID=UPI0036EAB3D0
MESHTYPHHGSGHLSLPELSRRRRTIGHTVEVGTKVPEAGAALRTLETALRRIAESQRADWAEICGSGAHE